MHALPWDESVRFQVAQSLDDPMRASDGESADVPVETYIDATPLACKLVRSVANAVF